MADPQTTDWRGRRLDGLRSQLAQAKAQLALANRKFMQARGCSTFMDQHKYDSLRREVADLEFEIAELERSRSVP